jgi:hypothetical protein
MIELLSFERAIERRKVMETLKTYGEYFALYVANSTFIENTVVQYRE